jgi:hypothetical protein
MLLGATPDEKPRAAPPLPFNPPILPRYTLRPDAGLRRQFRPEWPNKPLKPQRKNSNSGIAAAAFTVPLVNVTKT